MDHLEDQLLLKEDSNKEDSSSDDEEKGVTFGDVTNARTGSYHGPVFPNDSIWELDSIEGEQAKICSLGKCMTITLSVAALTALAAYAAGVIPKGGKKTKRKKYKKTKTNKRRSKISRRNK
jgi:hypothetical protein